MRFLIILFFILLANITEAQPPCSIIPGMTPQTAIPVCGTTSFYQPIVTTCTGPNVTPSPCPDIITSDNSFWYKFHCYNGGLTGLGFLIKPDVSTDDYDWALFDVTGRPLNEIFTNGSLQVSVNISGAVSASGWTGCSPAGSSNVSCAGNTPLFNRLAGMITGNDYMLMVTNWSNSGQGYTLEFTGGDAVITDNTLPVISSVTNVGCSNSILKVVFSKDIRCSSVTTTGSEFSITPGAAVITGITSLCTMGFNSITELTIQIQNPLAGGNYNLVVNPGSDGNTFRDACGEYMITGFSIPFTLVAQTPVTINTISYTGCAPSVLNVPFSKPVWCNSITATGSEFSILPGNPAILSVQSQCGAVTNVDQLQIVLQNPLTPGNYQLLVNNGTDGNTFLDTCGGTITAGTLFPFVIAAASTPPVIQTIGFAACQPFKVVLNFDKPINCASLTAAGTEFSISPGVWPISSISSSCGAQTYTSQITLTLSNPLPGGNYNVNINNGTDGNTLSDTCLAFIPVGYNKSFVATQAPPPVFVSTQVANCNPDAVRVFYSFPIQCSTVSPDGTDFTITGPSAVNIIAATANTTCAQGYTTWIDLQFASPVTIPGTYTIHNGIGTDGNGIIDTCFASQVITETINFDAFVKPSAVFNSQVNWGCVNDTIVLSHPGGNGVNSWNWKFSDGSTATGQNVSKIFPVATPTVDIELIVSNGLCSDTATQTIILGNVFNAGFSSTPSDTFCINTPVNFTDTSSGNIVNYLWDFGDLTQYNGQNPPTHFYPLFNNYNVQLIVTDNYGCKDTASKILLVTASAFIDFTGLRSQYCTDNKVTLTRDISRNIDSYTWDNGDGLTFVNKVFVQFTYPNPGVYTITLTGNDKYCGPSAVSKTVPVYAVPKVNLGPDTVLCPAERMLIGVPPVSGYTYNWSTGAVSSQIMTDIFTRKYKLLIDNNGCNASDEIAIKVLPACLIKVPGAFTPNGDGLNDILRAVNADLARNFSLKVYNRLGQLLFTTNIPVEGWDGYIKGNKAETGTYVWMLSYTDPWTGNQVKAKGTSILLR